MQHIDWKRVYAKAEEMYPRYKAGIPYSQLAAELQTEGLDQTHIDYVVAEMAKRHQEEKQKRINGPVLLIAMLLSVLFLTGLVWVFQGQNSLYALVGCVVLFIVLKMVFKGRGSERSTRKR
jgi:uncharacterized membrane protein YqjE